MEKQRIYCSACDREVEVLLRDGAQAADDAGALEGAVCLDIGERCTGTSCPICAIPPDEIRAALVRIGAPPGDG